MRLTCHHHDHHIGIPARSVQPFSKIADGVHRAEICPVISAKDEFANIKNISAQDILNAHRFPAGLAGIVPQNTTGLGDVEKAERIYKKSEIAPIQRRFMTAVNNDPEIPERLHLNFDLSYTESTDKDAA